MNDESFARVCLVCRSLGQHDFSRRLSLTIQRTKSNTRDRRATRSLPSAGMASCSRALIGRMMMIEMETEIDLESDERVFTLDLFFQRKHSKLLPHGKNDKCPNDEIHDWLIRVIYGIYHERRTTKVRFRCTKYARISSGKSFFLEINADGETQCIAVLIRSSVSCRCSR